MFAVSSSPRPVMSMCDVMDSSHILFSEECSMTVATVRVYLYLKLEFSIPATKVDSSAFPLYYKKFKSYIQGTSLSSEDKLQDHQWVPETTDSINPYRYPPFIFFNN